MTMDFSELLGRSAPFNTARDEVNVPMIRRWCDVMDEHNPVYTDPAFASSSVFGGIIAPIAMLDVWDKPGIIFERDDSNPQSVALTALDGAGFTSTVAVNSDLEQSRPLRPGDLVHSVLTLEDISPEKQTGLGAGHFVTSRIRYLVGDEVVGSVLFRVLKFKPGTGRQAAGGDPPPPPTGPTEMERRASTRTIDEVSAEEALPELAVPITATLVIAGALITLDYFDGHHDRDAAVAKGSKDIFTNIHTSLGLVQRYVSDWAGPEAVWRNIKARLGAPNYPGDTMLLSGNVISADPGSGAVTVAYRGVNSLGPHMTGTAEVVLPRQA